MTHCDMCVRCIMMGYIPWYHTAVCWKAPVTRTWVQIYRIPFHCHVSWRGVSQCEYELGQSWNVNPLSTQGEFPEGARFKCIAVNCGSTSSWTLWRQKKWRKKWEKLAKMYRTMYDLNDETKFCPKKKSKCRFALVSPSLDSLVSLGLQGSSDVIQTSSTLGPIPAVWVEVSRWFSAHKYKFRDECRRYFSWSSDILVFAEIQNRPKFPLLSSVLSWHLRGFCACWHGEKCHVKVSVP